jgi:(1->4)-alpha-D-glucan 1-alpha-D-glucosylmutase
VPPPDREKPPPGPVSTYRLQLRPGFGFAEAAGLAGYLAHLGVTHACLPPILQAQSGSTHGYDVVDHSLVSVDLGGEAAFRAMVEQFRRHGLGVIVDVMPGHMAIPVPAWVNRQLWSVLSEGSQSPYAHWFDIDWTVHGGRLLLPLLAGPVEECLQDLAVDDDPAAAGPVLRYGDSQVLPLRRGTGGLPLAELLDAQCYRLADWRIAGTELNWRRLLNIATFIGVRVEEPDVFADTHRLLIRLVAEGLIDGLRVTRVDSLADPRGYLRQLAAASGGAWVVAEKILTRAEELPRHWPCAGTTGYDALSAVDGLFVEPGADALLRATYVRRTGGAGTFAEVAEVAKRETASLAFAAELSWLGRLLTRAGEPELSAFGAEDRRTVLIEILVAFPVARAYLVPGEPLPQVSGDVMARVAESVRRRVPPRLHPALRAVCLLLLGRGSDQEPRQIRDELIVRFQQTCDSVSVMGIESTAFFRWSRLAALNEVGGEPDRFGVSPAEFHVLAGRLTRDWPATLTTLSTHDTLWQEDVRARLAVLAEWPQEWAREVADWHAAAAALPGGPAAGARLDPEPDVEYLIWQILVGTWKIDQERLGQCLLKAIRQAKTRTLTSWIKPNREYESAVLGFVGAILGDPVLTARIADFVARIAPDARVNSLGAKLVQLTMPGVPNVYQGCELTGFALMDPDNRRPVDFALRQRLLATLDEALGLLANPDVPGPQSPAVGLDAEKLLVTSRALRLRRDHPDWFAGSYRPLPAEGRAARHAIAFIRGGRSVTVATRLPAGLRRMGGWADTVLPLPDGRWLDVLTGASHAGPHLQISAVTDRLPVALLVSSDG